MNAAKNFVEQESRPGLELVSIPHIAPVQFMIRNRAMKTLVLLMEVRYFRDAEKVFGSKSQHGKSSRYFCDVF